MLAERVRRGELPPVEDRLPDEPLVVVPLEEVGEYGGSWLRMMKGTSDFHAFGRCIYEQMLRWAPHPKDGIVPGLVKEWVFSDGGKVLTIRLRKGLRRSRRAPAPLKPVGAGTFTIDRLLLPEPKGSGPIEA